MPSGSAHMPATGRSLVWTGALCSSSAVSSTESVRLRGVDLKEMRRGIGAQPSDPVAARGKGAGDVVGRADTDLVLRQRHASRMTMSREISPPRVTVTMTGSNIPEGATCHGRVWADYVE